METVEAVQASGAVSLEEDGFSPEPMGGPQSDFHSSGLEELARAPLDGSDRRGADYGVGPAKRRGVSGFQALVKRVVELTTELSSQVSFSHQ
jgi:hypothetical protein